MPLARFSKDGEQPRLGKVFNSYLIDLAIAAPELPKSAIEFLRMGSEALATFDLVGPESGEQISLSKVKLHSPIPNPEKYLAIGMNYADHGAEAKRLGIDVPGHQVWFNKQVSCINGPYDDVVLPCVSEQLDYEAELAVVMGKECRYVAVEDAHAVIGGYMVANDVSARDWQFRTSTVTLGKSFDTHGPLGPWLTLADEVENAMDLAIRMTVNGVEMQRARTTEMVHDIYEQISYLSQVMTLRPGDILATGTPSGVGVSKDPKSFLKVGDLMRVEIESLGFIENRIVAETSSEAALFLQ